VLVPLSVGYTSVVYKSCYPEKIGNWRKQHDDS
jgi:hypothetical protein